MWRLPSFALVLVLAVLAAGCGSKSSEPTSPADWADGVCSAITTWKSSITSSADSLKGGNLTQDSLKSAGDDMKSATDTLESDLKDLGKPDTQSGQQAKDSLDQLSSDLKTDSDSIKTAVDDVTDLSGVPAAATTVGSTLANDAESGHLDRQQPQAARRTRRAADRVPAVERLPAALQFELAGNSLDHASVTQNTLHTIRAYEDSRNFDGTYPQEIQDAFASSARMLASTGARSCTPPSSTSWSRAAPTWPSTCPRPSNTRRPRAASRATRLQPAQGQAHLDARHELLKREYEDISRRTGPVGLEAAHEFITGAQDSVYDPNVDTDSIRGAARVTAEAAAAAERGMNVMGFLSEFDKEAARIAGPGSSWSDEEQGEVGGRDEGRHGRERRAQVRQPRSSTTSASCAFRSVTAFPSVT